MMHNPAHPGEVIRESCLIPSGLTVREAAEHLGVTRKALSDLLNGHSGMSPEMALRLENAGWSTADTWLCMQMNWRVGQQAAKIKVRTPGHPASPGVWHHGSHVHTRRP